MSMGMSMTIIVNMNVNMSMIILPLQKAEAWLTNCCKSMVVWFNRGVMGRHLSIALFESCVWKYASGKSERLESRTYKYSATLKNNATLKNSASIEPYLFNTVKQSTTTWACL